MCLVTNARRIGSAKRARTMNKTHTFYKVLYRTTTVNKLNNITDITYFTPYRWNMVIPGNTYYPYMDPSDTDITLNDDEKYLEAECIHLFTSKNAAVQEARNQSTTIVVEIKVPGKDIIAYGKFADVGVRKLKYPKKFKVVFDSETQFKYPEKFKSNI